MNKAHPSKYLATRTAVASVAAFLFAIAAWAALYELEDLSKYVHKTCTDYSSSQYKEVGMSYNRGNTSLDGNKDGVPCNYLYEKSK